MTYTYLSGNWAELWHWAYVKYMHDLAAAATKARAAGRPLRLDEQTEKRKASFWATRYVERKVREGRA